jgi:FtsP/CotA-like multicopper oxidase with cupredoxin domain
MPRWGRLKIIFLVLCLAAEFAKSADNPPLPLVAANDNRKSAGLLKDGVLNLQLDLCRGRWYPEDQASGYRDVYAFAEHGQPPQISGPLIRVPQGTRIHATIRNTLPVAAAIFGLHRHPGDPNEAIKLQPGEMREVEFLAGEPGAYLYWAATSGSRLDRRYGAETQLSGAFVVDSSNTTPQDRIFVISIWMKDLNSSAGQQIPAINGKSWPYTERLTYKLGEPVHWRVIDGSFDPHAMHLHGFYFTMTAVGDGERYERIAEDRQQKRVTQSIEPGHAFEMIWTPERIAETGSSTATCCCTCRAWRSCIPGKLSPRKITLRKLSLSRPRPPLIPPSTIPAPAWAV